MVALVLVSHSVSLASALRELVLQMAGSELSVVVAAGAGDDHTELGTDAVYIAEMLTPFCKADGAVVLMDLGSAVLSAQTALELLDAEGVEGWRERIRLCPAPLVEAAVAAAVAAASGASLDDVAAEAERALLPKQEQLAPAQPAALPETKTAALPDAVAVEFNVTNAHGLHARPAASLARFFQGFAGEAQLRNLTNGRGPSAGRSMTALSLLQALHGHRLRAEIAGPGADELAKKLQAFAADGFGESAETAPEPVAQSDARGVVGVSAGLAMGRPLALEDALAAPEQTEAQPLEPGAEIARFEAARAALAAEMDRAASGAAGAILAAHAAMLRDPVLAADVHGAIRAGALTAEQGWREACGRLAASFAALDDDYLRARAADVRDVERRLLLSLAGAAVSSIAPDPPAVLFTTELLPSQAMACDRERVLGVVAQIGSPTAHAAILMRSAEIPMIVGVTPSQFDQLPSASCVALDGGAGRLWIDPSPEEQEKMHAAQQRQAALLQALERDRALPAVTADGVSVEILANVSTAADARAVREQGAEGVGLLRTEFVFHAFRQMPTEDEQAEALRAVIEPLGNGPLIVRTPDIGADKPLPFLAGDAEANPFLGVRGLRLSMLHPEFFASNLRAILRAGTGRALHIMVPMVSLPAEMRQARRLLEQAHQELDRRGVEHAWPAPLGMMVEVPAAALQCARFVDAAEFFSIGTNDLTQYLMAAERGNAQLGALQDAAHPAVLAAVRAVCRAAGERHVSVCGDAASDPLTATLLVAAGVRALSVRPRQAPLLKATLRKLRISTLTPLLERALELEDAASVRAMVASALPELVAH